MKHHSKKLPPSHCLDCGKICDAATGINAHRPRPGDITVCFYCGHVMAFGANLELRPLTTAEMHSIAGDKLILKVQAARLKAVNRK